VLLAYFERARTRPPDPVLVDSQSAATLRIGIRDVRLDTDPRRILSDRGRREALACRAGLIRLPDSLHTDISSHRRREEHAEDRRVDYVAVTRARRRLTMVVGSADGKWPLPLKHLFDAIAHCRDLHPGAVLPITGTVSTAPRSDLPGDGPPWVAPASIEVSRQLTPLPISPTRLESLLNAD
jgi:hypothetical protein